MPQHPPIEGLLRLNPARKPTDYPEDDPHGAMQLALEQLRSEFPRETSAAKLKPMGAFTGNAYGRGSDLLTFPTNTIRYNPDTVMRDQGTNADRLAHELVHVGQNLDRGAIRYLMPDMDKLTKSYWDQPDEQEAWAMEDKRRLNRQDIKLLPEK
jgi:hypothetical protein